MAAPKKNLPDAPRPKIRRKPLHEDVAEHLRLLIVEGHLKDGERIIETELCEQLKVSRTPLREAIKMLIHEGLIEHLPNRGASVAKITPEQMQHLFQVISGLEMLAAELTIPNAKPLELKHLRALHEKMIKHHSAGERQKYFSINHQIHLRIVSLSGNPILIETHAGLMARARHFRYWALADQERWDEAVREHEAIMEAFEKRDAKAAGQLIKAHVERTGDVVQMSVRGVKKTA